MRRTKLMPIMTSFLTLGLVISATMVSADDTYPTLTTLTDANGVTLSSNVSWDDPSHANDNYNATLDISLNGAPEVTVQDTAAVQVVQDISTLMTRTCFHEDHVTFERSTFDKSFTTAQQKEMVGSLTTQYVAEGPVAKFYYDIISSKTMSDKNDWFSLTGYKDINNNTFTNTSYLVPRAPLSYWGIPGVTPNGSDGKKVVGWNVGNPLWYCYVVKNPLASSTVARDPLGYRSYLSSGYHAGVRSDGSYYSLSSMAEPNSFIDAGRTGDNNLYQYDIVLNQESKEKAGCITKIDMARSFMSTFADELVSNSDNELSINAFSTNSYGTSDFTSSASQFKSDANSALSQTQAKSNFNEGLKEAAENLEKSTNGRKYIVLVVPEYSNCYTNENGTVVNDYNTALTEIAKTANEIKAQGIEIYTVGLGNLYMDNFVQFIATDANHVFTSTSTDAFDTQVSTLNTVASQIADQINAQSNTLTIPVRATVENTISDYYTVNEETLSTDITLTNEDVTLEDGTTRTVQKVSYEVKESDLDENGNCTKSVPLTLKEEYQNPSETTNYPVNDETNGLKAIYSEDQEISVPTTYLSIAVALMGDSEVLPGLEVDPILPPIVKPDNTGNDGVLAGAQVQGVSTVKTDDNQPLMYAMVGLGVSSLLLVILKLTNKKRA